MNYRYHILFVLLLTMACTAIAQPPAVSSGKVIRYANFSSVHVTPRHVDVWLPDGYENNAGQYAVFYMHDGQMLFDSTATWNHQEWGMDEISARLIQEKKVRPFIIVGIWNGGETRHADYFPQKPFESLPDSVKLNLYNSKRSNGADVFKGKTIVSDGYLKFIVGELKPFIDKTYRTNRDRNNTFIAGSSMGGLISLYAICEYPQVFGGAACISTHWPGIFRIEDNPIPDAILSYLKQNIPDPADHKIYFDCGTETLDAIYPALQKKADVLFQQRGYRVQNYLSKVFEGANHSEAAWKARMDVPLLFLLSKY